MAATVVYLYKNKTRVRSRKKKRKNHLRRQRHNPICKVIVVKKKKKKRKNRPDSEFFDFDLYAICIVKRVFLCFSLPVFFFFQFKPIFLEPDNRCRRFGF